MLLSKTGTDLTVSIDSMIDILDSMEGKEPPTRDDKIAIWKQEMVERSQR